MEELATASMGATHITLGSRAGGNDSDCQNGKQGLAHQVEDVGSWNRALRSVHDKLKKLEESGLD